jgi:hypothetical protein
MTSLVWSSLPLLVLSVLSPLISSSWNFTSPIGRIQRATKRNKGRKEGRTKERKGANPESEKSERNCSAATSLWGHRTRTSTRSRENDQWSGEEQQRDKRRGQYGSSLFQDFFRAAAAAATTTTTTTPLQGRRRACEGRGFRVSERIVRREAMACEQAQI